MDRKEFIDFLQRAFEFVVNPLFNTLCSRLEARLAYQQVRVGQSGTLARSNISQYIEAAREEANLHASAE